MNAKFAKWMGLVFLASLALGISAFYYRGHLDVKSVEYKPVFGEFSGTGVNGIKHIRLQNSTSDTNLLLENDIWIVSEEDGYYANMKLLDSLLKFIQNAIYYSKISDNEKDYEKYGVGEQGENAGTLLTLYLKEKEFQIILGKMSPDYFYTYIRFPGQKDIWMVDTGFQAPRKRYSWLEQPILSYRADDVEAVRANWQVQRMLRGGEFKNSVNIDTPILPILEQLSALYAEKVIKGYDFKEGAFAQKRELVIKNYGGLITFLKIYSDGSNYWATIKISTDNLPTLAISDYIKNNRLRYDGWMFKLPEYQGSLLLNYNP